MREALEALRQAGYVQTRRGRGGGTFVTYGGATVSRSDAGELVRSMGAQLQDALDFRRVVEPGAAALAATRVVRAEDAESLRDALEAVATATDDRTRRGADSRLHLRIAELAGSPLLLAAVTDAQLRVGRAAGRDPGAVGQPRALRPAARGRRRGHPGGRGRAGVPGDGRALRRHLGPAARLPRLIPSRRPGPDR